MSEARKRFEELAREARPYQERITEISVEQVKLAHTMGVEIVKAAFPEATVTEIQSMAEIRPTDFASAANNTVAKIKELGLIPVGIIIDNRRFIIHLVE